MNVEEILNGLNNLMPRDPNDDHPDNFINPPLPVSPTERENFLNQFKNIPEEILEIILKKLPVEDLNSLALTSKASYAFINNWRLKFSYRHVHIKRKTTTSELHSVYGAGGLPSVHRSAVSVTWKDPEAEKWSSVRGHMFFRFIHMNFQSLKEITLKSPYLGCANPWGPFTCYLDSLRLLQVLKKLDVEFEPRRFDEQYSIERALRNIVGCRSLKEVRLKICSVAVSYVYVPEADRNHSIKKLELVTASKDCPFNGFLLNLQALEILIYKAQGMCEEGTVQMLLNLTLNNRRLHSLTLGGFTRLPMIIMPSLIRLNLEEGIGDVRGKRITSFLKINPSIRYLQIKLGNFVQREQGRPHNCLWRNLFKEALFATARCTGPKIMLRGSYEYIFSCLLTVRDISGDVEESIALKHVGVKLVEMYNDVERLIYIDAGDLESVWSRWDASAYTIHTEYLMSKPDERPSTLREYGWE